MIQIFQISLLTLVLSCYTLRSEAQCEILQQSLDASICVGGSSAFSVTTDSISTYQWQYLNSENWQPVLNELPSGAVYSNTDEDTLSIEGVTLLGIHNFRCIATDSLSTCADTSEVFQLNVVPDLSVTAQPLSNQSLCIGGLLPISMSASVTGGTGSPTYQWSSNNENNAETGNAIVNAISNTYTPPIFSTEGIYFYYLTASSTGSGCNSVVTNVVSVNTLADPTISPPLSSQAICLGGTLSSLTAIVSGGIGTSTYQWFSNNSNNNTTGTAIGGATSSSYTPPTTPVGTKYYYCNVVQTGAGCSALSSVSSVQIAQDPLAPSAIKSPNVSAVCAGDTLSLVQVQLGSGGTGNCIVQYSISQDGGDTYGNWLEDLGVIVASLPSTIIKIRTNCSGSGCNISNEVSFSWDVMPSPILVVSSDQEICIGESAQIFVAGATEYFWFPQQTLDFEFISNPTATPFETTTYTVGSFGSNGCDAFETVTIQVNNPPSISAGEDVAICIGESVTLNASGADSFSWNPTIGLDNPFVANPEVDIDFNVTYTVSGTDSTGCMATDYVTLLVNQLPIANAGEDAEICVGNSFQLQASGGTSFEWTPLTGLSSDNIPYPITTTEETVEYHVTVTDNNGCTASDDVLISVNPMPSPSITGLASACMNEYWAPYHTAANSSFYSWSVSGGEIMSGQGTNEIFVHWLDTGTGSVSVLEQFISSGCSNESSFLVEVGTNEASDTVELELLGNTILTCPNCAFTEYMWGYEAVNGGPSYVSCEGTQYCQFSELNTNDFYYWLLHGDGNGCLTKSYYNAPPPVVSIKESTEKAHIKIFPNPVSSQLNVEIGKWPNEQIRIDVFDINSNLIYSKGISKQDSSLQLSHLTSGLYFLKVELDNETSFLLFVKF